MSAFMLQVWDFDFKGGALEFQLHRYAAESPFHGAFEATACPDGHQPAGNGVTFVKNLHQADQDPVVTVKVAEVGTYEYRRTDTRHTGSLLVAATLPKGYVIPDLASVYPEPVTFKVFRSRMAFYWKVGAEQKAFYWKLQRVRAGEVTAYCKQLNRELHVRERAAGCKSPGLDGDRVEDNAPAHVFRQLHEKTWRLSFGSERRTLDCGLAAIRYIPRLLEFPGRAVDDLALSGSPADVSEALSAEIAEAGLDAEGETKLRQRVAFLQQQIVSRDASEAGKFAAELERIEKALRDHRGPGSRQRPVRNVAKVKAQKRVAKNLQTLYPWLAEHGLPLLADHLARSIRADGYGHVYRPDRKPTLVWDVGLLMSRKPVPPLE